MTTRLGIPELSEHGHFHSQVELLDQGWTAPESRESRLCREAEALHSLALAKAEGAAKMNRPGAERIALGHAAAHAAAAHACLERGEIALAEKHLRDGALLLR